MENEPYSPVARTVLVSVRCPACGVQAISPSLGVSDLLERHLRYCSWEPSDG